MVFDTDVYDHFLRVTDMYVCVAHTWHKRDMSLPPWMLAPNWLTWHRGAVQVRTYACK